MKSAPPTFGVTGKQMEIIPEERGKSIRRKSDLKVHIENKYTRAYEKVKQSVRKVKHYIFGYDTIPPNQDSVTNLSKHQEALEKKRKRDQKLRNECKWLIFKNSILLEPFRNS